MNAQQPIGYGPRLSRGRRPIFNGDERSFEIWELKFTSYLRICSLHKVIENPNDQDVNQDQNAEVFAELVQCLDDRSINLIIRDARDNGRKALKILQEHYRPKGKARVITLYTELTSLSKGTESVTDYIVKAESITAALREAEETISDSLLIAMILKGLPEEFKPFAVVVNDKGKMTFSDFKVALRNFEDNDKLNNKNLDSDSDAVMELTKSKSFKPKFNKRWCTKCKMSTHDTEYCKRFCTFHKSDSHWTSQCRNKSGQHRNHASKSADVDEVDEDHHFSFMLNNTKSTPRFNDCQPSLLVDSGATVHILNKREYFDTFDENFKTEHHTIELADGTKVEGHAEGQGTAVITLHDSSDVPHRVLLNNTLYIPMFKHNIFSVSAATKHGATVSFTSDSGHITFKDNSCVFNFSKSRNLYFINTCRSSVNTSESKSILEWHRILGHCNVSDIRHLEKAVKGMSIKNPLSKLNCEPCALGKMTNETNRLPEDRAKKAFERVCIDLAGPVEPIARDNFRYALICVDDFSNLISTYLLKQKSDACLAFKKYLADISPYGSVQKVKYMPGLVKYVRSDSGGEFISKEFSQILIDNKIKHEKTAPYSPHQNGKAERAWRTIFEMARCLLLESQLPKCMWSYAVMTAAYIRNRCYNHRLGKTPFEAVTLKQPNLKNMHVFGEQCFALVQNPKKLENRSEKGVFVGYDKDSPSYLVYFPERNTIKKCRVVKFFDNNEHDSQTNDENEEEDSDFLKEKQSAPPKLGSDLGSGNPSCSPLRDNAKNSSCDSETENNADIPQSGRGARAKMKPNYLNDYLGDKEIDEHLGYNITHYCYIACSNIPQTYSEAISSTESEKWKEAMQSEMNALVENETFDIVPLPEDRKAIKGKWVYAIKSDKDDNETFKARFVAKGYSQVEGIDYNETFSPTARMNSIRLIVQISVEKNLELHQMDVKTAFLNAPIDCSIYVEQPEGYVSKNKKGENLVLRLKKSLYGLKQSGRNWNSTLHTYLIESGFKRSINDPCFYYKEEENIFLVVWVDDLLIAASSDALKCVKHVLESKFRMKDLGQVSLFLGIEFEKEVDKITMSQTKYITRILERFGMQNCKPKYTSCEMNPQVTNSCALNENELKLYRQIIGALIYIMTATRPDLSYVVTKLSQFMSCASENHMIMAKHVLRYLKGTMNERLVFVKSDEALVVTGFCDADWTNGDDRKSITGYCFKISKMGPMISWKSRKQPTVALSSCEAEYMSLASAAQEGKYLVSFLNEILNLNASQFTILSHFTILCDNQGAISLSKNPIKHNRSKHIDIKYHFIRDEVENRRLEIQYVSTEDNVADVFTKPMSKIRFQKFRSSLFG